MISDVTPAGSPIKDFFTDNFNNVTEVRHGDFSSFAAQASQDALHGTGAFAGKGAAEVFVVGRTVSSASYGSGNADGYNGISSPFVNLTAYTARALSNRLGWHTGSAATTGTRNGLETTVTANGVSILGLTVGSHDWFTDAVAFDGLSLGTTGFGGGKILATQGANTIAAYWAAGDAPGSPTDAGVATFPAVRLLFNLDNAPNSGNNGANDITNLTTEGLAALVSAIDFASPLTAGLPDPVHLSVNAGSVIRRIDARIFGANTAVYDPNIGTPANATLLSAAGLRSLRFPGGSLSDTYDWHRNRSIGGTFDWVTGFPKFAVMAESLGAQPYLTVNYGDGTPEQAAAWVAYANASPTSTVPLGVDAKGRNWQTAGYWAGLRGASPLGANDGYNFLRIAHPAPFGFQYWEVGNENYGSWENDQHGVAGSGLTGVAHDPYTYAQNFKLFRDAMLAVDPTVALGSPVVTGQDSYGNGTHAVPNPNQGGALHSGWTPVVLATLKSLGVAPHFIVHHAYAQAPGAESDATLLQGTGVFATDSAGLRQQLTDYVGGAMGSGVEIAVTELNSVYANPGKQTVSLVNGLYLADALPRLARTEIAACHWWALRNSTEAGNNNSASLYGWRDYGDYGIFASGNVAGTPANTPFPSYYALKLLTHWGRGGDTVLAASSDYSGLAIHAARLADGRLALLVVNKNATADLNAQITLTGFAPGSATASVWSYGKANDLANADLTAGTITNAAPTFARAFPSYSMTAIVLAKPLTPLEAWRKANFGTTANTGNAADDQDPDKDGLKNILEFWLVSPPNTPSVAALPVLASKIGGGYTFTYTRRISATDATYLVIESDTLQSWAPAVGTSASLGSSGDTVTIQFTIPAGGGKKFYSLKITSL